MNNLKLTSNINKIVNGFSIKKITNILGITCILLPLTFSTSVAQNDTKEEKIDNNQEFIQEVSNYSNKDNEIIYEENGIFYFNQDYMKEYLDDYIIEEDNRFLASLTFDDGPTKYTKELLDLLDEYKVKATFFVIGRNIEGNEETIIDAYQRGHEIAIHTYNHKDLTTLSIDEVELEINKTIEKLLELGITPSKLVRPPYGKVNKEILENIDHPIITWNVDTEDWNTNKPWNVIKKILEGIDENEIILLHDIKKSTIEALENVLPSLVDDYKFVTVSKLFKENEQKIEYGVKYKKVK